MLTRAAGMRSLGLITPLLITAVLTISTAWAGAGANAVGERETWRICDATEGLAEDTEAWDEPELLDTADEGRPVESPDDVVPEALMSSEPPGGEGGEQEKRGLPLSHLILGIAILAIIAVVVLRALEQTPPAAPTGGASASEETPPADEE